MGLKRDVLRGGVLLSAGSAIGKALALARNIIIARLISPEDFGIAATFIITLSLLQSISEVAADKLLVQAKDGDEKHFQKVLHFFQCLRGAVTAAIIFVLAGPIASLFGSPSAVGAFRLLAVIPLLRGFAHLDMRRVQRGMNFKPFVVVDVVSQAIAVLVAFPIGWWLGDYRAALWILIIQTFAYTSMTHILAERRWGAVYDQSYLRRLLGFGWPLIINGLLMFLILQGDRIVIGATWSHYTLADLGVYSVALTFIMTPRQMLTRVSTSILLPILSKVQDEKELFTSRYRLCSQISSLIATGVGVTFIIAGTLLVKTLYGENYAGVGLFIGWLSAMQTLRIIRTTPAIAGLARADSSQLMLTNLARAVSLLILLVVAYLRLSLAWVAAAGVVGEALSLTVATWIMRRKHGLEMMATFGPTLASGVAMALAGCAVLMGVANHEWPITVGATALAGIATCVITVAPFPEIRSLVLSDGVHIMTRLRQMAGPKRKVAAVIDE